MEAGGTWELQIVMEKELVLQASLSGVLLCFMVFRKCFAVEEQCLQVMGSDPAAERVLEKPSSAVPGVSISNAHTTKARASISIGHGPIWPIGQWGCF